MNEQVAAELVRRGREALVRELGANGAIQYMQHITQLPTEGDDDQVERAAISFDIDPQDGSIIMRLSARVAWIRMTPEQARQVARSLEKRANALERSGG